MPLVILIVVCLAVSAILVPVAAHLPRWAEIEFVLIAWWAVWVGVLSYLLYHGHEVDDAPKPKLTLKATRSLGEALAGAADPGCCFFPDGCLVALAVLVLLFAALLIIELVTPALAVLLLASIGGMLARAVNDTHACQSRLGLSLLWGAIWATLYIGPLAAVVAWLSAYLTAWT